MEGDVGWVGLGGEESGCRVMDEAECGEIPAGIWG